MKYFSRVVVATSMVLLSNASFSGDLEFCDGTISKMYIDSSGGVVINPSYRYDFTKICNINVAWKGVSTETCKSWVSLALSAKLSKSNVKVRYKTNDINSCPTMPTYGSSPAPDYIMLDK